MLWPCADPPTRISVSMGRPTAKNDRSLDFWQLLGSYPATVAKTERLMMEISCSLVPLGRKVLRTAMNLLRIFLWSPTRKESTLLMRVKMGWMWSLGL